MKIFKKLLLILSMGLVLIACSNGANNEANEKGSSSKPLVYASFYPIYDITEKIAGDKLEVRQLVPDGAEAHDFNPSSKDIVELEKADMLVINGNGMEGWAEDLKTSLSNDLILCNSGDGLELIQADEHSHGEGEHDHEEDHEGHEGHGHDHGGVDPHTWTSPRMMKAQAENIKDAISKMDPANKDYYQENLEKLSQYFDELDKEFTEASKEFKRTDLIISHEALSYLCRDYGLEQIGLEAIVPESEPSPDRIAAIIDFIKENDVKAIYYESLGKKDAIQSIADQTGTLALPLNTLETISEEEKEAGDDYFSIMRRNLDSLKEGLN